MRREANQARRGRTVFNYNVTNTVRGSEYREGFIDTSRFAGKYIVTVFAADFFGNTASKEIEITIGD